MNSNDVFEEEARQHINFLILQFKGNKILFSETFVGNSKGYCKKNKYIYSNKSK